MNRWRSLMSCVIWSGLAVSAAQAADPVDFNRDIRPILSNNCFHCHGPDEAEAQGGTDGLRLDTADGGSPTSAATRRSCRASPTRAN